MVYGSRAYLNCYVGGITELRKIATMAEAFDVTVIPHCPLSPIAFAANLQVVFCSHNAVMQEQDLALHDLTESVGLQYFDDPETFEFDDGYVSRLTEPGWGSKWTSRTCVNSHVPT